MTSGRNRADLLMLPLLWRCLHWQLPRQARLPTSGHMLTHVLPYSFKAIMRLLLFGGEDSEKHCL